MPQNDVIQLAYGDWTELTTNDVSRITFTNQGAGSIAVTATAGPPPVSTAGMQFRPNDGVANVALTSLWPGVTGAVRVWALGQGERVFVSHA